MASLSNVVSHINDLGENWEKMNKTVKETAKEQISIMTVHIHCVS